MIPPGVVLLVREGCHLCEEAFAIATEVCATAGRTLTIIDVDSDPDLQSSYTDHVPVTLVDGDVLSYWFVDPVQLTAALTGKR